ncbi:hypothetical protein CRYUN_Cryun04dG0026000 [Craigia yunnanensis]
MFQRLPTLVNRSQKLSPQLNNQIQDGKKVAEGPAALGRKRISIPRANRVANANKSGDISVEVADKGHFVIYTADESRFVFPIAYLNNYIIRELFKMSVEEFGLHGICIPM